MSCCNVIKLPDGPKGYTGLMGYTGTTGTAGADGQDGTAGGIELYQVRKFAKDFIVTDAVVQSPLYITKADLTAANMLQQTWWVDPFGNWGFSLLTDLGIQIWIKRGTYGYTDAYMLGIATSLRYNMLTDRIEVNVNFGSVTNNGIYRIVIVG